MEYASLKEMSHIQFRYVLSLLKLVLKLTNHLIISLILHNLFMLLYFYIIRICAIFFIYENNTKKQDKICIFLLGYI